MAIEVLVCDEAWDTGAGTCAGTVTSLDIEGVANPAVPFDWAVIDNSELAELFAYGFSIVVTMWAIAWGAGRMFDVLNRS